MMKSGVQASGLRGFKSSQLARFFHPKMQSIQNSSE
jgi:hypothetical protein